MSRYLVKVLVLTWSVSFQQNNYDQRSISSGGSIHECGDDEHHGEVEPQETKSSDPAMPTPPPDLTLGSKDILIIKYCGVTGVILAVFIFCSQVPNDISGL